MSTFRYPDTAVTTMKSGDIATPANEGAAGETRSDRRIPKLRTRGRANRERLLTEAQKLIEAHGSKPVRFSDVFEAAGVSRGSAYRIYDDIDDLMQDLSGTWINRFTGYIRNVDPEYRAENWQQLSDQMVAAGAAYWAKTTRTLRVMPRVRVNAPESYRVAARQMTRTVAEMFESRFVVPEIDNWLDVINMYVQIGDTIFSDGVRRDGHVSEQCLRETQKMLSTYLSLHLPAWLPVRERATN